MSLDVLLQSWGLSNKSSMRAAINQRTEGLHDTREITLHYQMDLKTSRLNSQSKGLQLVSLVPHVCGSAGFRVLSFRWLSSPSYDRRIHLADLMKVFPISGVESWVDYNVQHVAHFYHYQYMVLLSIWCLFSPSSLILYSLSSSSVCICSHKLYRAWSAWVFLSF